MSPDLGRYACRMSSPTRWAGVPLTDRRIERRALLIGAAFVLFGDEGESAVSVRSVCRQSALNSRYFYESFADTDELLGAVYDQVAADPVYLAAAVMSVAPGRSWRDSPALRVGSDSPCPMRRL